MATKKSHPKISIEKPLSFVPSSLWLSAHKLIYVIGCGGNGSHLVPHLARLLSGNKTTSLCLIDGDQVEKKNLIRQHFTTADLGKNKAEVLCSRYSSLNPRMTFIPEYFTSVSQVEPSEYSIVISCTDSFASRALVDEVFDAGLWIDLGNEKTNGQVIISSKIKYFAEMFPLPTLFELYPDLRSQAAVTPVTASCAEQAEALPSQVGFVNLMAASLAMNYLYALFTGIQINSHQVLFSIENRFETRSITKGKYEEWRRDFPRFRETE